MLIVAVIGASLLAKVYLTSVNEIQASTLSSFNEVNDKINTQIKILTAVNISSTQAKIWLKNTGSREIAAAELARCDLFYGPMGNFSRLNYAESGEGWNYTVLNGVDHDWGPSETMEITVTAASTLPAADYYVSFNTFNGVQDEFYFTIGG